MKAEKNTVTVVYLDLDLDEARWLKGLCQNPLHENETELDEVMRSKFFRALDDAGVK